MSEIKNSGCFGFLLWVLVAPFYYPIYLCYFILIKIPISLLRKFNSGIEKSNNDEYKFQFSFDVEPENNTDKVYDLKKTAMYEEINEIRKKYRKNFLKHVELEEKIGQLYSVAYNLTGMQSKEIYRCIQLCSEDIDCIKIILEEMDLTNDIYIKYDEEPFFQDRCPKSLIRLMIIFEKQANYDVAIDLCKWALDNGFLNDGSDGGIVGRMARLTRKNMKNHK